MNENIQTSSQNLFGSTSVQPSTSTTITTPTNTRINSQLDSSLQGYLRAATKLTRNLEKANQHTQLLHTAIVINKPPRGLIPKITPRILDTSTQFIINWENTLQDTAITLTKQLKSYWEERALEVQKQLEASLLLSKTSVLKHNGIKFRLYYNKQPGKPAKTSKERNPISPVSPDNTNKKNRHYRKPTQPKFIINLSQHILNQDKISLLSKGLNFIPTPKPDHPAKILQDLLLFHRKLRLKYHFHQDTPITQQDSDTSTESDIPRASILTPNSGWTPPSGQDTFLDTYRSMILKTTQDEITNNKQRYEKNLKKQEITALRNLQQNHRIVIKPAD